MIPSMTKQYAIGLFFLCLHSLAMHDIPQPAQPFTFTRIITEPYTPDQQSTEIIDVLLCDPKKVYIYGQNIRQLAEEELRKVYQKGSPSIPFFPDTTSEDYKTQYANAPSPEEEIVNVIAKYENIYPLLFLQECDNLTGGSDCLFNRMRYPKSRNLFERVVSQALISKIQPNGSLVCTSFASGRHFQDLKILLNVLTACPCITIALHTIDITYQPYNLSDRWINLLFGKDGFDRRSYFHNEHIRFLTRTFPKATLSFSAYPDVQAYTQHLATTQAPHADFVYAIDILDENNERNKTMDCYRWLCAKTLQNNQQSGNMLFEYEAVNGKPHITSHTLSLTATPDSQKYDLTFPTAGDTIYETVTFPQVQ